MCFDIMTLSNTGPEDQTRVNFNTKYLNVCAPSHLLVQKEQMVTTYQLNDIQV